MYRDTLRNILPLHWIFCREDFEFYMTLPRTTDHRSSAFITFQNALYKLMKDRKRSVPYRIYPRMLWSKLTFGIFIVVARHLALYSPMMPCGVVVFHSLIRIYMGGLIQGINNLYRLFCFFKLFPMGRKELISTIVFGPLNFAATLTAMGNWQDFTLKQPLEPRLQKVPLSHQIGYCAHQANSLIIHVHLEAKSWQENWCGSLTAPGMVDLLLCCMKLHLPYCSYCISEGVHKEPATDRWWC